MKLDIPKRFSDDLKWAYRHFPKWKSKYGNRWIAVRGHRVLAAGDSGKDVIEQLNKKAIDTKSISIIFVEKGAYVY